VEARVPDTFQLAAILPFAAFLASRNINNLHVFNTLECFDSPRLHFCKYFIHIQLISSVFARARYVGFDGSHHHLQEAPRGRVQISRTLMVEGGQVLLFEKNRYSPTMAAVIDHSSQLCGRQLPPWH
jgi:hypothetical protein